MKPIKLNPDNKHYFTYKGKDIILITSAEHYGALINKGFDFIKYFDTLKKYGFNLTRAFSGFYREKYGDFNIEDNTLAPLDCDFICPWKKKDNKYDLDEWDEKYFKRLRKLLFEAYKRDIIVEYTFFCYLYNDYSWQLSPMKPINNININNKIKRQEVYTGKNQELFKYQVEFVKKNSIINKIKPQPLL